MTFKSAIKFDELSEEVNTLNEYISVIDDFGHVNGFGDEYHQIENRAKKVIEQLKLINAEMNQLTDTMTSWFGN